MVNTIIHFKDGETLTIEGEYADALKLGNDTHLTICGVQHKMYVIDASTVKYAEIEVSE